MASSETSKIAESAEALRLGSSAFLPFLASVSGSHPSETWEASKVSATVTEEHLEDFGRVNTHSTHVVAIASELDILAHFSSTEVHILKARCPLIPIVLDISAIVSLFLLGIS